MTDDRARFFYNARRYCNVYLFMISIAACHDAVQGGIGAFYFVPVRVIYVVVMWGTHQVTAEGREDETAGLRAPHLTPMCQ
ncbi:hypothetical protein M378DRAFT_170065 [Amanita muscaria Koide BX008]|uniref:Uncharacterized protein n=1 Tax=Amanita muscaria (strain Koide BX008) TaxID=946122 RepID=A0A0C2WC50_AMAMK|nr:hypothetical protein M378DRAFT_170065 [Amanita muscaria Koide BX008]